MYCIDMLTSHSYIHYTICWIVK